MNKIERLTSYGRSHRLGSDSVIRNASCNKENSRLARSERQRRSDRASVHQRVRRQGQEVNKVVRQRNLFE